MDVIILWMSKKDHMMCSIRELHRDLYDDKMGLAEAIDAIDGKELISDTRLRSLIPPFFKPMTELRQTSKVRRRMMMLQLIVEES